MNIDIFTDTLITDSYTSYTVHVRLTIRYDTIAEFNVDSKAEYTA